MELIIEKIERLGWNRDLEDVHEVGGTTVYRFKREGAKLSLYVGLKGQHVSIEVAGKRIGFRINVSPTQDVVELYAYAMRRHRYSEADVEKAAKQVLEELKLLSDEAVLVAKAVLDTKKEA